MGPVIRAGGGAEGAAIGGQCFSGQEKQAKKNHASLWDNQPLGNRLLVAYNQPLGCRLLAT